MSLGRGCKLVQLPIISYVKEKRLNNVSSIQIHKILISQCIIPVRVKGMGNVRDSNVKLSGYFENDCKNLCMKLVNSDTEEDVINILSDAGLWQDNAAWNYFGNNENNFSSIGNQQSSPDSALVEKIINSVDACLMRECLRNGIIPESKKAPQSLKEALEEFFNIKDGILSNLKAKERQILSQNIVLTATGSKQNPCYSIIDKGEGQTPSNMENTFLSLSKSNKLRIPFVQGKFNMGGTGALQFCGKHNIQLILSRRDPEIIDDTKDESYYWGFTIIRRDDPSGGMRSSTFKYLAPNGKILKFRSPSLELLPGEYPKPYENPLDWGTFIKLYEYRIGGLKTVITLDLNYRLSLLLPNIALPVSLYERRENYKAHTYNSIISGLSVRLDEDKHENIEPGFPDSSTIKINGQELKIKIYVFKKDAEVTHYKKDEGILFTINGQSHGFIDKSFFHRNAVGMAYLANSILLIADCTGFDGRSREDLFMNSRDRLREGELRKEIELKIKDLIKDHPGLRELKEKRRREELKESIKDDKPLVETIEKIFKSSPSLTQLFIKGEKISNPFNLTEAGSKNEIFKGKDFPTYFKLKKENTKDKPKLCPINQRFRVQFETDAINEYFTREVDPGSISVFGNNKEIKNYTLNLWNGIANLTIELGNEEVGDTIEYHVEVTDLSQINPFTTDFFVLITPEVEKSPGPKGGRINPPAGNGHGREKESKLDIPHVTPVYQNEWDTYKFNKETALIAKDSGESGYDFYINMDNVHLLSQIRENSSTEPEIYRKQYEYGMVLIGISLLNLYSTSNDNNEVPISDNIEKITKAISPILIPMIGALNKLEID